MRNFVFVVLLTLSGCASDSHFSLEERWRPLKEIRERPTLLRNVGNKTAITTIGTNCYVRDLDEWLGRVVPGTAKFDAIMRHEQEHARRQLRTGTYLWIARYSYDKKFALKEEQIGYFYEITERRRRGDFFLPEAYAVSLASYEIITGRLISYEKALAWVRDVIAGRWLPPSS